MLTSYSYSSLDSFRTCPRQFQFRYVEKPEVAKRLSVDLYLGTAVHRVLKTLYSYGANSVVVPEEEALRSFREQWEKVNRKALFIPSARYGVDDYIRLGAEMLLRHYRKYQPFNQGTLLGAELPLRFVLPGTPFLFRAVIDRLWKRDDGVIEICDYKTGQHLTGASDPAYVHQMGLYQVGIRTRFPHFERVEQAQYFLRHDEVIPNRMSPEQLDEVIESFRVAVVATLEAERLDHYPAVEGGYCAYCDFIELCPAKKHRKWLDEEEEEGGDDSSRLAERLGNLADSYLSKYQDHQQTKAALDGLKAEIVEASRNAGVSRLEGDAGSVSVRVSRTEKLLGKTTDPDAYAQLQQAARDLGLDDYFILDASQFMKDIYRKGRLSEEALVRLKRFVQEQEVVRVTVRFNKQAEDESEE